ncbi:MAG: hypothetical protein Q7T21_10405 [Gallionella sp.]|nr:hypothetical protein [Gallionella sp.]
MIRFLLIGCVVFVAGCFDDKKPQEAPPNGAVNMFSSTQPVDNRSLEERVRTACTIDALGKKSAGCGNKKEQQ